MFINLVIDRAHCEIPDLSVGEVETFDGKPTNNTTSDANGLLASRRWSYRVLDRSNV